MIVRVLDLKTSFTSSTITTAAAAAAISENDTSMDLSESVEKFERSVDGRGNRFVLQRRGERHHERREEKSRGGVG